MNVEREIEEEQKTVLTTWTNCVTSGIFYKNLIKNNLFINSYHKKVYYTYYSKLSAYKIYKVPIHVQSYQYYSALFSSKIIKSDNTKVTSKHNNTIVNTKFIVY